MDFSMLKNAVWGTNLRQNQTIIALVFFLFTAIYLLVEASGVVESEVLNDRYWKNIVPLFNGEFPVMEYPPLAIVFFIIPRLFASSPTGYLVAWTIMATIFAIIGMLVVSKIAEHLKFNQTHACVMYAIVLLPMWEFVVDRFDIFAMVIVLLAFLFVIEKKYPWVFVLLVIGTLVKVYPAMFLPVFLIYIAYNEGYRAMFKGFMIFVLVFALIAGVFVLINPETMTNFLGYNGDRPLQIESVMTSVVYVISLTGVTSVWKQGASQEAYWSDNLRGTLPDAVAEVLMPIMVAGVLLAWLLYWYLQNRDDKNNLRLLALACGLAIAMFLILNKVFSAQYIIWFIGPMVIVLMVVPEKVRWVMYRLLFVTSFLSMFNFFFTRYIAGVGSDLNNFGGYGWMFILIVRNILMIVLTAMIIKCMFNVTKNSDDSPIVVDDVNSI